MVNEQQHQPGTVQLPLIALRGIVAFPDTTVKLELGSKEDLLAVENAAYHENTVFLISLKQYTKLPPYDKSDFSLTGTVAKIEKKEEKNGILIVEITGLSRGKILQVSSESDYAQILPISSEGDLIMGNSATAVYKETLTILDRFLSLLPGSTDEIKKAILKSKSPGALADSIACAVLITTEHKEAILNERVVIRRLTLLNELMKDEIPILEEEMKIHSKVRTALEDNQREYYLKEQLHVIKDELGIDEEDDETKEYREKILGAKFPKEIEEKLLKELEKLEKTPYSSAEATVERNYLDTVLEIPFNRSSSDRTDVSVAKEVLEKDHYGLEKVKERILEYVAAKQLNPDLKNQTICLVGPPGVGKTSIAASLAKSLNREYVRVSLGGVRDEADIRGHRKTYVAAMPGRIINALIQAKVNNPLILLDEIDKMGNDSRGDPASAMLEVLDGEQNKTFRDHFVEMPVDLSNCIFVSTANTLSTVAPALIDRMEIIELASYTAEEKVQIAKKHLIPKQRKRHGILAKQLQITESAINKIILSYTREAGVRNLERSIASICRKAARVIIEEQKATQRVTDKNLDFYLGHEKALPERIYDAPEQGVVNGLAWTEAGGELLRVEAVSMPGDGKMECTGNLGDVMKESGRIALSCIRSRLDQLGLQKEITKEKDIHIHFPEGATPKDGPSAGCAIYTALVSELSGKPVRQDLAMTGEITLHGRVLPIGGLREKAMAAFKAGVHTVLIPEGNKKDLADVDPAVLNGIHFIGCSSVSDVIKEALLP